MICADCGEDNNIVYYLDGSWICWDCILKACQLPPPKGKGLVKAQN